MKKSKSFFEMELNDKKYIVQAAAEESNRAQRELMEKYGCKSCGVIPGQKHKDTCETMLCKHCGGNLRIRNPIGYCDHLYYPENCKICKHPWTKWLYQLYWGFMDRCNYCGGHISGHINGRDYCDDCGMSLG